MLRKLYRLFWAHHNGLNRQQYVLSMLLMCSIALASFATAVALTTALVNGPSYTETHPLQPLTILLVLIGLYLVAHYRSHKMAAYIVIGLFVLVSFYSLAQWGILLPQGVLIAGLSIVMSGILIGSRASWITFFIISGMLIGLAYFQQYDEEFIDTSWMSHRGGYNDVLGFIATFAVVGFVTVLYNKELEEYLRRLEASDVKLRHERDILEVKVKQRTHELEQNQMQRIFELQRFAEFGRISAGLIHDIANPLTAASLNLEELRNQQDKSEAVVRARKSMRTLEEFVDAARKQLQNNAEYKSFNIKTELTQILRLLGHKAKQKNVKISLRLGEEGATLYGDHFKFSQVMVNLITNSINSYTEKSSNNKITITLLSSNPIRLSIKDNGRGVSAADQKYLFKPFFSTRGAGGIGLGLSMVKEVVENEFGGSITFSSAPQIGTEMVVVFYNASYGETP